MPVTVTEKWESRDTTLSDDSTVELIYTVQGTDDDYTASTNVLATAPIGYVPILGILLVRRNMSIERVGVDSWEATVTYGRLEILETGGASFTFETSGGTQHLSQSLGTLRYPAAGATAPDFQGAINVTQDNVDGVDITFPIYTFSETYRIDGALITDAYKYNLYYLTGRINADTFRGFAAGEVLFLGANGSQRSQENWEITYKFSASPNAANLTVGPISGITKRGWDYLWVRYAEQEDAAAKRIVKRPLAAYVEVVYYDGDFTLLGLGS